jgi:hypothetical protein
MSRHPARSPVLLIPLLASMAIVPMACSRGGGEDQLLDRFFRAARSRDNMTLGNIAAVSFNPNQQGVVERFTVTEVSPEQRRAIDFRQLTQAHAEALAEEEAFSRRMQEFHSANVETISRVAQARDSGRELRGADAEVYSAMEQWRDEQNEYSRRLSEAQSRLSRDRAQVVNSLSPAGGEDVDVSDMDVELVSKRVTVDATVRTPDGVTEPRTMVFTFQRAIGTRDGQTQEGRWIITDLEY